jgi:hypothetical protein
MPRLSWKGAISFGLVTISVNLYSATYEIHGVAHHVVRHLIDPSIGDFMTMLSGAQDSGSECRHRAARISGRDRNTARGLVAARTEVKSPAMASCDRSLFVEATSADPRRFRVSPGSTKGVSGSPLTCPSIYSYDRLRRPRQAESKNTFRQLFADQINWKPSQVVCSPKFRSPRGA